MKLTRNMISEFLDISSINDETLCDKLNSIGLEVESIQSIKIPSNVVVAKVLEKQKHPNATKLNICKVDIGSDILQIVCGAKNVKENQYVALALEGALIGSMHIKPSKIRDIDSYGMICSSLELGLKQIDSGILILDSSIGELVLGKELREYPPFCDSVFEINVTPNRGDCLSVLGIARDISAAFNLKLKPMQKFNFANKDSNEKINVEYEKIKSSLFFGALRFSSVEIKNNLLLKLNLSLIDELQDCALSNFIRFATHMSGVLIDAYVCENLDFSIRCDTRGVESVFLNESKMHTIGICNRNLDSILESSIVVFVSSFIPPNYISELIFKHKIECSQRVKYLSTRGTSPCVKEGMEFLFNLLQKQNDIAFIDSKYIQNFSPQKISLNLNSISSIIGNEISSDFIFQTLENLGFTIDSNEISIPPYRHDIFNTQDIAEEILRLRGVDEIDSIPQNFNQYKNLDVNFESYKFKREIAKNAIANKFFECIHYAFCSRDELNLYKYKVLNEELDILNPITNDLNTLRTSLIPHLINSVIRNKNYGFSSIKLFEIGSIYNEFRDEKTSIAFVAYGLKNLPKYPNPKPKPWDFYSFASKISDILGVFNLSNVEKADFAYHPNISANIVIEGKNIGLIGKLNPFVANRLNLKGECFICEISIDELFKCKKTPAFREFSKYQSSQRDLSILVKNDISFASIKNLILEKNMECIRDIIPLDVYSNDDLEGEISISFRICFQSMDGTLRDIDLIMEDIISTLESDFKARLR